MSHWTEAFYRCVDAGDPAVAALFAPGIRSQINGAPQTVGVPALFGGPLGRIAAAIDGSRHEFLNIWDVAPDTAVLESKVTYRRRDGRDIEVAGFTVLHRDAQGLIDEMRFFADTALLFEGWMPPVEV